ncbi:MAG: hypothetical protein IKI77_10160 [Oscillospiraceae bacterium]|nr:hypothetical protein [Oscillospiraceae bacterium]
MKKGLPYIWLTIFAVLLMFFGFANGAGMKLTALLLIALHIAIPVTFAVIGEKKEKQEKERYRRDYVKEISLDLAEFGTLGFEHDIRTDELTLVTGDLPEIRGGAVMDLNVEDYSGKTELVLKCLRTVFGVKEQIAEKCLSYVKETYEDEGITEYNGEPLTDDFLMQHMCFDSICIVIGHNAVSAVVSCYLDLHIRDHISEHGVTVNVSEDGTLDLE